MAWFSWVAQVLVVGAGFGAGMAIAVALLRRFRPALSLRRIGPPTPDPWGLTSGVQVWRVPDPQARREVMIQVCRALLPTTAVVLAPAGQGWWDEPLRGFSGLSRVLQDRPTPHDLLAACRDLSPVGRPLLLVEGPDALEAPTPDEEPEAPLVDLLEARRDGEPLLVVLCPGEVPAIGPDRELRWEGHALTDGSGLSFDLPRS